MTWSEIWNEVIQKHNKEQDSVKCSRLKVFLLYVKCDQ